MKFVESKLYKGEKEDLQDDGDSTFWNFYRLRDQRSDLSLSMTLSNIVPPFIKDISYAYILKHSTAEKIFQDYPRRMSHKLSFQINQDTIRVSYKFDDTYGKSFVFIFESENWYLKRVEYFIGELPSYWWKSDDFYFPLNDRIK